MADAGRYRIVRQLGRGGMAEVFEAVAIGEGGFERRVAIKRMLADLHGDPAFATLFLDEARTASALHHANLVAVLDYGIADGLPFQVLEFVDGRDAERLSRTGRDLSVPMPVEVAMHLCLEVAHALDYVHTATDANGAPLGIVHRDVSPSNVLVATSGDVKLTDFGIALARSRATETSAGVIRGKPAFMAPEQVVRGAIDGRTDVFGLGCTLHAMLTGVSPLSRENAMVALLSGGQLELDPALPDDVRAMVARATQSVRHQRYPSAADFAADLSAALATRGHHNARADVQRWLELIRSSSRTPTAPRGALDAMMAIEFVLAPPSAGVRHFVTASARADAKAKRDEPGIAAPTRAESVDSPAVAAPAAVAIAPPAEVPTEPELGPGERPTTPDRPASRPVPVVRVAPSRRSGIARIAAPAALVVVAIGSVLVVSAWRDSHATRVPTVAVTVTHAPSEHTRPESRAEIASPSTVATAPATTNAIAAPGEPSTVASTTPAPTLAAASAIHRAHPERPRNAVTAIPPVQPTPAPAPVEPTPAPAAPPPQPTIDREATGVVAIGGDGAQRAEILVDGARHGFAPRVLTLPVGHHAVELVRPDGQRIGPESIEVVESNTPSAPLHLRFP